MKNILMAAGFFLCMISVSLAQQIESRPVKISDEKLKAIQSIEVEQRTVPTVKHTEPSKQQSLQKALSAEKITLTATGEQPASTDAAPAGQTQIRTRAEANSLGKRAGMAAKSCAAKSKSSCAPNKTAGKGCCAHKKE